MTVLGKDVSSTTYYASDSAPEELGAGLLGALALGGEVHVTNRPDASPPHIEMNVTITERTEVSNDPG